ncbi:hypothetical protein Glove_99g179 [Diversispora epigaea]|uniref:F-box domain-containing protein n=1 Tax=Diversispora epigaea TaxID=1348612 RepID=A0A397J505_9GLOM|nr:hypothetical protein Glove_99g179 [Diversispora epigaea]
MNKLSSPGSYFVELPIEILISITDKLNIKDQQNLSWTCKIMYRLVRICHFGVASPVWEEVKIEGADNIPVSCYRDGVWINGVFYLPVFNQDAPICWTLDFNKPSIIWSKRSIILKLRSKEVYVPIRHTATAAIGNDIYIFGGEDIRTRRLTNIFYCLNVMNLELHMIVKTKNNPRARMMHTLNSINHNNLALFGGRCHMKDGQFYDIKEFSIFNTRKNTWTTYEDSTEIPYPRSIHSSTVVSGRLYIYGGQRITSVSLNLTHEDQDIWVYDIYQEKWHKFLSPLAGKELNNFELPQNWVATNGKPPGSRIGAAIFPIHFRIAILGGIELYNFYYEDEKERPWEFVKLFSPSKHNWEHVRVKGMPRMKCVAIIGDYRGGPKDIFIIGKSYEKDNLITEGNNNNNNNNNNNDNDNNNKETI